MVEGMVVRMGENGRPRRPWLLFFGWCVCCWRRKEEMKRRGEDIKGGGYIYKREKLYNILLNETSLHSKLRLLIKAASHCKPASSNCWTQ